MALLEQNTTRKGRVDKNNATKLRLAMIAVSTK